MLTFGAIADKYRPKWLVWENVPGVLSSNGGRDFGTLLGGLAELGYGFAYRVLDAQYVRVESHPRAVPQRRRRVFVVGYLGDWRRAAAVLLERESLCGHPAPRRISGEGAAPTLASRARGGGGLGTDFDRDGGLGKATLTVPEVCGGLSDGAHLGGGKMDRTHTLAESSLPEVAWALQERDSKGADSSTKEGHLIVTPQGGFFDEEHVAKTLLGKSNRSMGHDGSHANGGGQVAVAFDLRGREDGSQFEGPHDTANLRASSGGSSRSYVASHAVRRLTPEECEALQGFPRNYTRIPWRGRAAEECPDGPRYKALGNSFAVNVVRWIGERIQSVESIPQNGQSP